MGTSGKFLLAGMIVASVNILCLAQNFKVYPGARLDEDASREASAAAPGKQSEVYTTADTLDKVHTFYKGLYKEYTMPGTGPKLPSGEQVQWAFFIIDEGTTLANSRLWLKIQRPYVGGAQSQNIRNVTVIQTVRTK